MTTTFTKLSSFALLAQCLVCGSFVPSAGLLGNYVGGLVGGSALKDLQARHFSSEIVSGEEKYVNEHYESDGSHEGEKHLDDEHFDGKHDLTEEIHDSKDHSDISSEHEFEAPESHQFESQDEDSHHFDGELPDIPEHHLSHDDDDEKPSDYEPNESKMLYHPALDFDSSESVKKIYHGKGGYSYSTLYENE